MGSPYRIVIEASVEDTGAWRLRINGESRWMEIARRPEDHAPIAAELVARGAGALAGWVRRVIALDREPPETVPVQRVRELAEAVAAQVEVDGPTTAIGKRLRIVADQLRRLCR